MTLHSWWPFAAAVFLLCGTPGPNMLHILSRSVAMGLPRAFIAMLGCGSALLSVLIASATGLSALLVALPGVYEALKWAGVVYLLFLGVQAWRANAAPVDVGPGTIPATLSGWRIFRAGFTVGISNPKLLLFAAAFLPQFVDAGAPQVPQFIILVTTFAAVECFWYLVYAFGGRALSRYLMRPHARRLFNRLTAVIFVGFGLSLIGVRKLA